MTRFPNCSHVSPGCTPGIRNRSFLPGFSSGCDPFLRGRDLLSFIFMMQTEAGRDAVVPRPNPLFQATRECAA